MRYNQCLYYHDSDLGLYGPVLVFCESRKCEVEVTPVPPVPWGLMLPRGADGRFDNWLWLLRIS